MPKGMPPSTRMTDRLKRIHTELGKIPQGYTIDPQPKNKNKTTAMPKNMREAARKLTKEGQQILKARMTEWERTQRKK